LDFVLKVLQTFDEVELYWLLNGKGTFPKKEKKLTYASSLFPEEQKKLSNIEENDNTETSNLPIDSLITSNNKSNIEKIVIFYKNGTFKLYNEQ
jgi:hypothetical protein